MTQKQKFTAACAGAIVALALVLMPAVASAQTSVTSTDIQRLEDDLYQVNRDVSALRSSQPDTSSRLQDELDDLRDEVIYLRVKLRKEGRVTRAEYQDVRDRIQSIRTRARGDRTTGDRPASQDERPGTWRPPSGQSGQTTNASGIPVGQEIDVRLQNELSSATAQVEDRFDATTMVDVYRGNEVLIPAGSVMRGVVRTVDKASRTDRKGEMTVSFDQITVNGRAYPMRGTVTQAIESEGIRGEAAKIGAGSAVGAIIGGIIGGVKGALLGVLIGGGGTIAATEGKDVTLPAGTILRVRLDSPPNIR
jgi:hypothetical protein